MTVSPPWMATAYSLDPKPTTFKHPMLQHSFFHILTACGSIAARWRKKRGNQALIKDYREDGNFTDQCFQKLRFRK